MKTGQRAVRRRYLTNFGIICLLCAGIGALFWRQHYLEYRRSKRQRAFLVSVNLLSIAKGVLPRYTNKVGQQARPTTDGDRSLLAKNDPEIDRYLTRFGYLDPDVSNQDLSKAALSAIADFQRQMGVPINSRIDSETRHRMSQSRCALPDLDPLGAMALGPWRTKALTYAFGHIPVSLSESAVRGAVQRAFATWAGTGAGLTFTEVQALADINIEWRPGLDPDYDMRSKGLVAHSDFPPGFSLIVSEAPLPLHFSELESWSFGATFGAYDVETVALHEIGHCLGLPHSTSSNSVMYPVIMSESVNRVPSSEDVKNLRDLYAQAP